MNEELDITKEYAGTAHDPAAEPQNHGKQDAPAASDFRKRKLDRKNLLIYPEIMKPKFDDYLD